MEINEDILVDMALLRQHVSGRWQCKYYIDGGWMFTKDKQHAIEYARSAYLKAPPEKLLTRDQRYENANRDEIDKSSQLWGHMTIHELQDMFERMGDLISSLKTSSVREFNGNGGRRASRAVSAQGARDTADMMSRLERYIEWRGLNANLPG